MYRDFLEIDIKCANSKKKSELIYKNHPSVCILYNFYYKNPAYFEDAKNTRKPLSSC